MTLVGCQMITLSYGILFVAPIRFAKQGRCGLVVGFGRVVNPAIIVFEQESHQLPENQIAKGKDRYQPYMVNQFSVPDLASCPSADFNRVNVKRLDFRRHREGVDRINGPVNDRKADFHPGINLVCSVWSGG